MNRLAVLACCGPIAATALLGCDAATAPSTATPTATWATRTPPTGTYWQRYQGIDLPVTDQGPRRVIDPIVSGFDRNPAGAAVAAIHASVRMSVASDRDWAQVGQQMLVAGSGRDQWAILRAQISITEPVREGAPVILGYQITRYTLDAADVEIYSRHSDDSITGHRTQVVWRGDGWRLLMPERPDHATVAAVTTPPADMVILPRP
ncbi:hypothetical protein [Nocardia bhagyanarayanae]|uniref:hypothetical protein n=1 Tax=Nocardia bhagyanarayanae TaxID=1215925 RepID=UPI00114E0E43|nr:hypothetical protein [Nocardia bhagyanarayanae]